MHILKDVRDVIGEFLSSVFQFLIRDYLILSK